MNDHTEVRNMSRVDVRDRGKLEKLWKQVKADNDKIERALPELTKLKNPISILIIRQELTSPDIMDTHLSAFGTMKWEKVLEIIYKETGIRNLNVQVILIPKPEENYIA